jgi:hypothetical protein
MEKEFHKNDIYYDILVADVSAQLQSNNTKIMVFKLKVGQIKKRINKQINRQRIGNEWFTIF